MDHFTGPLRVGIFVDVGNMYWNGGNKMQYDVMREFAARDGAQINRMNAYVSYDPERGRTDDVYQRNITRFHSVLRDFGYKVIVKELKWFEEEGGKRYGKANADLDMAVDILLQSQSLDRILLATGDGDFVRVVNAVQNRGSRVEIVAFNNVSRDLKREADMFISGYLIPNLLPVDDDDKDIPWGEVGSIVRGVCYFKGKDYGFMRFIRRMAPNLWLTDAQNPESPYDTAYFRLSNLPSDINPDDMPSYHHIFEFTIAESKRRNGDLEAKAIRMVSWMPV
ncbi:MAG: NYN domain-containing protein [Bacteroidales bacterium]|nr:NYN domain-containing protein [Bacteroidales bacterium]